jgi:hypothetical protein
MPFIYYYNILILSEPVKNRLLLKQPAFFTCSFHPATGAALAVWGLMLLLVAPGYGNAGTSQGCLHRVDATVGTTGTASVICTRCGQMPRD